MNKKPEYEVANDLALNLFESLKIKSEISLPFPNVREDWPSIGFKVSFSNGKSLVDFDYFLGIGHVKLPNVLPYQIRDFKDSKGQNVMAEHIYRAMQKHATLKKGYGYEKMQAEIASYLAKVQKVQPKSYEVLASICREGVEAIQTDFEEWASNFGYDSDSKKAEKIYLECRANYTKVLKVISSKDAEKFAEYANQF